MLSAENTPYMCQRCTGGGIIKGLPTLVTNGMGLNLNYASAEKWALLFNEIVAKFLEGSVDVLVLSEWMKIRTDRVVIRDSPNFSYIRKGDVDGSDVIVERFIDGSVTVAAMDVPMFVPLTSLTSNMSVKDESFSSGTSSLVILSALVLLILVVACVGSASYKSNRMLL